MLMMRSGHGEISANIELNAWNYSKRFEGDTAYTDYQATNDYVGGDCMVGTRGKLCSVEMVKRRVLDLNSRKWTLTLDMCRGLGMRGGGNTLREKMRLELP